MTRLRVIEGGPSACPHAAHECQETRIELAVSIAERAMFAANARPLASAAMRALRTGHDAAAGLWVSELLKLIEREANRAASAASLAGPVEQAPALTLLRAEQVAA